MFELLRVDIPDFSNNNQGWLYVESGGYVGHSMHCRRS